MKKPASLITYVAALVIGILLLSLHEINLLKSIVIAMGVLITVPSFLMFLSAFIGNKDLDGRKVYPAWYTILVAIAGLVLGIWMLVMPSFFMFAMVYALGVILILVGAAQIVFIKMAARPYGVNPWWYCIPILVVAGGFIICFLGPQGVNTWATLTTGILLIVYSANGLASFGRECKVEKEIKAEEGQLPPRDDDFIELK